MEIDINRSCRSCLRKSNLAMHPISNPAQKCENLDPTDKKDSYIPIMSIAEISPDDGLPQSVCTECLHQIQQVFQFKEKCEASDLQLRYFSLNRADPISCIKSENEGLDQVFQPETVLVTKFEEHTEPDDNDDDDDDDDKSYVIREKKQNCNDSKKSNASSKIKVEPTQCGEMDEKTLLEQVEIVDGRYQCKLCEKTLADRQTFKLHIRLHIGTNLKRCPICHRGFAKKNHLDRHLATHGRTYKCSKLCSRSFQTVAERKEHELLCKKKDAASEVKVEDETQNLQKTGVPKSGLVIENHPLVTCKEEVLNEENEQADDSFDPSVDGSTKTDGTGISMAMNRLKTKIPLDDEEQRLIESAKVEKNRYECPLCTKILSRDELLVRHIRTAHTGKNLLRCTVCDKGFATSYNLSRHMLIHDTVDVDEVITEAQQPDGTFRCTFCAKTFVERKSFRVHLRTHTTADDASKRCEICNEIFVDEEQLEEHMQVHGEFILCAECDEVFKTLKDRKIHVEREHSTAVKREKLMKAKSLRRTPSKRCTSDDNNDDDDEDELLVNSAELLNGRYKCKFCEKTLAYRSSLKLHIRLHLQKKLKMCELCGHGSSRKSHLDRHMKTHFPKKPECKLCHTTFESMHELKEHMTVAHKVESKVVLARSHKCDLCPKSFTTVQRFNDHRRRHFEEEKQFACDICAKEFRRYDNMRAHMRSHIPIHERVAVAKTHLCSYCGQSFSSASNLTSNIRTHTDSRFRRSCDLSCHRRTHTGYTAENGHTNVRNVVVLLHNQTI